MAQDNLMAALAVIERGDIQASTLTVPVFGTSCVFMHYLYSCMHGMVSVTSNRAATDSTHLSHASLTPLSAPTPCMQAGETALHAAARNDNSEAVELLLQHKASVDIQDRVIRGDALVVANMLVSWVRA